MTTPIRCAGNHFGLRVELWVEFGPDIMDKWGIHRRAPGECAHWATLPDDVAATAKRLAGTLRETA